MSVVIIPQFADDTTFYIYPYSKFYVAWSKVNAYKYRERRREGGDEEKKITHKEAIASFDNLFKYLEDSEDFNDKDLTPILEDIQEKNNKGLELFFKNKD